MRVKTSIMYWITYQSLLCNGDTYLQAVQHWSLMTLRHCNTVASSVKWPGWLEQSLYQNTLNKNPLFYIEFIKLNKFKPNKLEYQ